MFTVEYCSYFLVTNFLDPIGIKIISNFSQNLNYNIIRNQFKVPKQS